MTAKRGRRLTQLGESEVERRSFMKAILKAEMWENSTQEAESRNGIITDKDELEHTAKVSRKGREKIST